MPIAHNPSSSVTPQQRPHSGYQLRRNHSESPIQSDHFQERRRDSFPTSSSSPQLASSEIAERERRSHERERRNGNRRDRRRRDARGSSDAGQRARRRRPQITIISTQPMSGHPAFADGNKGGYIPPEAPPSYEQAMRETAPPNSTFTDPTLDPISEAARGVFPGRMLVNRNAVSIPSYTDSIASQTTSITSSIGSSTPNSSTNSSPVTTQRSRPGNSVTSHSAHSPTRRRNRNINSNSNQFGRSSREEQRERVEVRVPPSTPAPQRPKPPLPSKGPVFRPKSRTSVPTGGHSNRNNNSNRRDDTPSPTRVVPPSTDRHTDSGGSEASQSTSELPVDTTRVRNNPQSVQHHSRSNAPFSPDSELLESPGFFETDRASDLLNNLPEEQHDLCTVNPDPSLDDHTSEMSSQSANADILDLFGAPTSAPSQNLPAPLLPSGGGSNQNGPQKPNPVQSNDLFAFDPFMSQPTGRPPPPQMSAPILPQGGAMHAVNTPAVIQPTQLPSAAPRGQTNQPAANSQPARPRPPNLPLAPSVAQPGAILTPIPTPSMFQTPTTPSHPQTPNASGASLPPGGGQGSRKLPPPPRPSSGPKISPGTKRGSNTNAMTSAKPSVQSSVMSPTKQPVPMNPTLGGAQASQLKQPHGGASNGPSLLDFDLPLGGGNASTKNLPPSGATASPSLMDTLLTPTTAGGQPLGGAMSQTPQGMDLFSMGPTSAATQSAGSTLPTDNPTPVPRNHANPPGRVPNLSESGPNPVIEPVYAAVVKKRPVKSPPKEESVSTPILTSPQKTVSPSSGGSLLDMLEPNKSSIVATELGASPPPPLPASRPPLEDFEDLLSPTEMNKALAERDKARKCGQNPPHATPRQNFTQNPSDLDDLLGLGPMSLKNDSNPSKEENPYELEDVVLSVEDRGLPHIQQSSPPPVLPAPRSRRKNSAGGPPPLPKTQPKLPTGGTVIYNAEGPSPEATLVMQQKKEDSEKLSKKLRRQSMKIKKSAMNVFKTKDNSQKNPENTEHGDSPKLNSDKKQSAGSVKKPKPARPPGPPPLRPANLLKRQSSPNMVSIQPHLMGHTASHSPQNVDNSLLITPAVVQAPQAAPRPSTNFPTTEPSNLSLLMSPIPVTPVVAPNPVPVSKPPVVAPNPVPGSKPKPSRPAPPKITPTRSAPARPPPIANTNQNNHTRPPLRQPPAVPTPKPRSGSKNEPINSSVLQPPSVARRPPPSRAAPTKPQNKPSRPPPALPPAKKSVTPMPRSTQPGPTQALESSQHSMQIPTPMVAGDANPNQQASQSALGGDNVNRIPSETSGIKSAVSLPTPTLDGGTEVTDGANSSTTKSNLSAVAMYDFDSNEPGELVFKAGDKITDITIVDDDWKKGWLNGSCGIFPSSFVAMETDPGSQNLNVQSNPPESALTQFPTWDDEPDVLPDGPDATTGDDIGESPDTPPSSSPERMDTPSSDQFFDSKEDLEGPEDTTATAAPSESEATSPMMSQSDDKAAADPSKCIALYSFTGQDDSELTFEEGDTIEIIEKVNDEWFTGELDGKKGIFPASFVEIQDGGDSNSVDSTNTSEVEASAVTSASSLRCETDTITPSSGGFVEPMATGLKDYVASSSEEVSFKVDDVLYLLEQVDQDWLMVQHDSSGAVGNVPVSHVKIIHPLPEGGGTMNWNP